MSQLKLAKLIVPQQFSDKSTFIQKQTQSNLTGKKVLLAEDNKINQMVTKALLEKEGIEVTIANDGIEAIEHYQKNDFSLILMDINMPRMGGLEALKVLHILMTDNNKSVPVIALTANALEGTKEKYLSAGMNGYLTKPIEMDKLFFELKKYL